jgi:riboflavin biosynthesis pyrimidine reductase
VVLLGSALACDGPPFEGRADIEILAPGAGGPAGAVEALAKHGVERLLVEGGPTLARSFVEAGLVDEVCVTLSPRLGARPAPVPDRTRFPSLVELRLEDVRVEDAFVYLRYRRAKETRGR